MKRLSKLFVKIAASVLLLLGGVGLAQTQAQAASHLGEENVMSVAWYQTSAESKALYLQGYNIARRNLDQDLQQPSAKPRAIILDIDETVLDNSPYQAYNALHNKTFPSCWAKWVKLAKAKPVPGAKAFLNYANSKGVQIYYVTDRSSNQLSATKKNLKREGLPQADNQHVLLKKKSDKTKESRRQAIEAKNNVIMFFGDNLTDFNDPKSPAVKDRYADIMAHANDWGSKYIILPNPMYGGWEAALYNGNYAQKPAKLAKERKAHLTVYNPKKNKVQHKTVTEK